MYIVQCVSSFLSLLQILKSVYHIKSIFENLNTAIIVWLIKHFWLKSSRNFCRQNSAKFSADSHDLKHSNYIYYTENQWQQPIYSEKYSRRIQNIFSSITNWSPARLFFASLPGPWHGRMHVAAGHLTPPSPPLSPCHLAPPSSPLLVNCPPCFSLSPLPILCHPLAPQFSPQTTPLPLILPLLASVFQPPWNPLILLNLCFFPKKSLLWLSSLQYSSLLALFPLKDGGI